MQPVAADVILRCFEYDFLSCVVLCVNSRRDRDSESESESESESDPFWRGLASQIVHVTRFGGLGFPRLSTGPVLEGLAL